jgi:hypothetical protein
MFGHLLIVVSRINLTKVFLGADIDAMPLSAATALSFMQIKTIKLGKSNEGIAN